MGKAKSKKIQSTWVLLISLGMVACSGESVKQQAATLRPAKAEEPIANAKKPTPEKAREYCLQHAAAVETVDQCIQRILGL